MRKREESQESKNGLNKPMTKPSTFSGTLRKSGSSLCIHIPKEIADLWTYGAKVQVTIEELTVNVEV